MLISTTFQDYPDNKSLAVILYFSGCTHACKGCHNPELQTYKNDRILITDILYHLEKNRSNKLVFSGGDCLYKDNILLVKIILKYIIDNNLDIHTCLYTGYDGYKAKEIIDDSNIHGFDFVKCGKYDITQTQDSLKTDDYIQFASKNQVLYDNTFHIYNRITEDNNVRYYFTKSDLV